MQIFDLTTYKPIRGERYFVDTNVWYWMTYASSKIGVLPNQPAKYQLENYPGFLEKILNDGAQLCHCPLTMAELANIIENTQLDLYRKRIGNEHYEKKSFRRLPAERKEVLAEIEVAWNTISRMSKCIDVRLDSKFVDSSKGVLASGLIDPFDAFFVQIMKDHKIDFIISDDHDFCTLNQQVLITANPKTIKK